MERVLQPNSGKLSGREKKIYKTYELYFMSDNTIISEHTDVIEPKKTRRQIQDIIRNEKALAKMERKANFRRKTEKKLEEKAERKIMHKVNNTKRKLEKKI